MKERAYIFGIVVIFALSIAKVAGSSGPTASCTKTDSLTVSCTYSGLGTGAVGDFFSAGSPSNICKTAYVGSSCMVNSDSDFTSYCVDQRGLDPNGNSLCQIQIPSDSSEVTLGDSGTATFHLPYAGF